MEENENYLKDFVPKKPALALKKLGFDEPCLMAYLGKEKEPYLKCDIHDMWHLQAKDVLNPLKAPTFSQAFRWFREKYNLDVTFRKMDYGPESQFTGYYFSIFKGNELIDIHGADKKCKLYEEAELACLSKLIEIVKQQTHATTN
jgi:hypothetical protein